MYEDVEELDELGALIAAGAEGELGPRVVVGCLASLPTGPALAHWLEVPPLAQLNEDELILVAAAMERLRRHNVAMENQVLARLAALPVAVLDHVAPESSFLGGTSPAEFEALVRSSRSDAFAAAAGLSTVTAGHRVRHAEALALGGQLEATGRELAAGRLAESKARLIADRLGGLSPGDATAIEARVLPRAEGMTRGRLDRELGRRVHALAPIAADLAHAEARVRRRVSRPIPLPDGMAMLEVTGPAEDVHLLWTAVGAAGAKSKRDARGCSREAAADMSEPPRTETSADRADSIDAHRFDALIDLACAALLDEDLPRRHGRRPSIEVAVSLSTLLDLDDEPAELEGYGPIAAEAARRIAADPTGTWRRLILRPDGLVIHADSQGYRPPQDLRDTVLARDRTCTFPGCARPARSNEIDHQRPWPAGDTSFWNLHSLCKRHHRAKTAGLWAPRTDRSSGDVEWRDPYGNTVIRLAAPRACPDETMLQRRERELAALLIRLTTADDLDPDGPPRDVLIRSIRRMLTDTRSLLAAERTGAPSTSRQRAPADA